AEMNKDYVPIPGPKNQSSGGSSRSLHHIDDEDEYEDGETVEVTDYTDVTDNNNENSAAEEKAEPAHREESAPRVRYDKNGNPIRSLHYIDFDEDEEDNQDTTEK
ncbi:MAG: hypothetical protein IJY04_06320, partial [Clostridia bacterium]|nr:hypothetical protein [Clostridia bacterium]